MFHSCSLPRGVFAPERARRVGQGRILKRAAARNRWLRRVAIAGRIGALVAVRLPAFTALSLYARAAYAGPEPDAGYTLLLLAAAATGLVVAQACAVGFLARLASRGFWRWCIAPLAATSAGLALFGSVPGAWLAHPEMSVLDILFTDLEIQTWSSSNLSLLATPGPR